MPIPLPADEPVKFLDLFGKPSHRHVKNVRSPAAQESDDRQATARKIDAIESEITAELDAQSHSAEHSDPEQLLEQRIAEASILYASRQGKAAEDLLLEAVARPSGTRRETIAWMMLLELAGFDNDRRRFEELSLRYAERFETSPPQWRARLATAAVPPPPTLAFRGKLLASSGPALAQVEQMAQAPSKFMLDLRGVTDIDSAGCSALLALFRRWNAKGKQVSVASSPSLLALLRSAAPVDSKDSEDGIWLLLIELLRISGDARAYEDACVDYSIAFEVSPPAPLGLGMANAHCAPDLRLPADIAAPVDALLDSLRTASDAMEAIILDCHQLRWIEFNAAAALLDGIAGLAKGKTVEWRDVPYLVSTLLQLVGGDGKFRISHRQP